MASLNDICTIVFYESKYTDNYNWRISEKDSQRNTTKKLKPETWSLQKVLIVYVVQALPKEPTEGVGPWLENSLYLMQL